MYLASGISKLQGMFEIHENHGMEVTWFRVMICWRLGSFRKWKLFDVNLEESFVRKAMAEEMRIWYGLRFIVCLFGRNLLDILNVSQKKESMVMSGKKPFRLSRKQQSTLAPMKGNSGVLIFRKETKLGSATYVAKTHVWNMIGRFEISTRTFNSLIKNGLIEYRGYASFSYKSYGLTTKGSRAINVIKSVLETK